MDNVVIIGGGAAGLAAAIAAASCGDRVTVLERMDRVGRKILATGNGRCNLMNAGELRFPGGERLAHQVLTRFGADEQLRFWEHLGLRTRQEEGGRVYPISGAASTVLDTLRQSARLLGVAEVTGAEVTSLRKGRKGWLLEADRTYPADRVIVAGGGCAQPKLGSNGSAYGLLTSLGHTKTKLRPALTQIMTDTALIRGLSGIRVRCDIRVAGRQGEKTRQNGELLFADYGITGVCVMQCARWAEPGDTVHIDLTHAMGFDGADALAQELIHRRCSWTGELSQLELLTGLCVPKLALAILRAAGLEKVSERPAHMLTERQLRSVAALAGDFSLTVKGVKGFDSAQVTAGGICCDEFEPLTLASRIAPGVHAAGEVLDVDGDCGGFNLMFAFGSGVLAGLNGRGAPW